MGKFAAGNYTIESVDFAPRALFLALFPVVCAVEVAEGALDGILVAGCGFVVLALEFCVADVDGALFAPVVWRVFPVFCHYGWFFFFCLGLLARLKQLRRMVVHVKLCM